jgi:hypothetical protein
MSYANPADTEADIDPKAEQRRAPGPDAADQNFTPEVDEGAPAPDTDVDDAPKVKEDPRQAKEREIVERANERRKQEQEQADAAIARPRKEEEPAAAPKDDDYVDLKVRKQPYRMTVKDRNELLREDFDDDDLVAMPEKEKNRHAQMVMARREYAKELAELKEQVNSAPKQQPQPQALQTAPGPEPEAEKSRLDLAREAYNQALEDFEYGKEGARDKLAQAQAEMFDAQAEIATTQQIEARETQRREQVFVNDVQTGLNEAQRIIGEQAPQAMADPFVRESMPAYYDAAYRALIAKAIGDGGEQTIQAFTQHGITPDYLAQARGPELMHLYKDMTFKGYRLPRPSEVIRTVASNVASRFSGNTQPMPTGEHNSPDVNGEARTPSVDRSGRKDEIRNQPGRANMPRQQSDTPRKVETPEERAARVRAEERNKRRGRPVGNR